MQDDPVAPDEVAQTLVAASEVLGQHLPDADGWCSGCLSGWNRLVFIEGCTQARWATTVRAHYVSAVLGN